MTQLEIDLVNGLPTLTPTKREGGWGYQLALSDACIVPNPTAKTEVAEACVFSLNDKKGIFFISPDIRASKEEKFNVMENLMTRGSESWDGDERFAEYRKQIPTLMKLAIANGLARLPAGYTMADLEACKGVRWNRKAGCSCPCSPAFNTPLIYSGSNNWMNATLVVKQGNSVVKRVARNPEATLAAVELRPVNKEAFEKAKEVAVSVVQG
jgi:hypothetical protein